MLISRCASWVWLGILLAAAPAAAQEEEGSLARPQLALESRLRVVFQYPAPGARVSASRGCGTFVAGRAKVHQFDIVLVLDTSGSTDRPSGGDIDADGEVGRASLDAAGLQRTSDRGDSVLAAEISAARQLLAELDAASTRVGVVAFAGSEPGALDWLLPRTPSARTLQTLTTQHEAVDGALDALLAEDPSGGTDMAGAIDRALAVFSAAADTAATPGDVHRMVLFFTDGYPTLPFGHGEEARNVSAVFAAAERAREAGVELHTFAIGKEAVAWPLALLEAAERTGGVFTPVRHPADLIDMIAHAGVGGLEGVRLYNATTGQVAMPFRVAPDGAFHGFVELVPGLNRIAALARTTLGVEARQERVLQLEADAPSAQVPYELLRRQTALLEDCLLLAKRRRSAAEAARAEELRRQLVVEIERARELARQRAREQRKRLQLELQAPR